jgi:hypothetical protein
MEDPWRVASLVVPFLREQFGATEQPISALDREPERDPPIGQSSS